MLHVRCPWPAVALAVVSFAAAASPAAAADAPGAPGDVATWTEGDKDGIGTATSLQSRALFTLDDGEMTEVFAPDLGTPSIRDLQFVVSDGTTFAEREREDATHGPSSPTRAASPTARSTRPARGAGGSPRPTSTDPARAAVLVDVTFESLTGRPYDLYALLDPGLSNTGDDDRAAHPGHDADRLRRPASRARWPEPGAVARLQRLHGRERRLDRPARGLPDGLGLRRRARAGNVVQTARLPLTGVGGKRRATLALGFGADPAAASATAPASLARRLRAPAADRYAAGWHAYLGGLPARPASRATSGSTTSR